MINEKNFIQQKLEMVYLEYLVPKDHILRNINIYVCHDLRALHYKTTTRDGYKEYVGNAKDCEECPNRTQCFSNESKYKTIRRHVWKKDKGRNIYKRRKETIEQNFADSKQLHTCSS
ncbi:transposase [Clostridium sp. Mt-5]|uniref:Transposase n=1 Tax=Clostridium moutaii TaxID=3240932 RepID=A0ABV4BLJ3_9CLOT